MYVTGPAAVTGADGALMLTVGAELSTANDALGPPALARLPAASVAVPGAMVNPSVPSPATPVNVTVRVEVPDPVTVAVPTALPVLVIAISASDNVIAEAPR